MDQSVVGPFTPQQPGGFGFNAAAYPYQAVASPFFAGSGSATPQPFHGASTQAQVGASHQAFATVPQARYSNGGNGAMASTPGSNMMPPQFAGQHFPYTTAPYSQSVPAQAPTAPALHQGLAQQQHQQAVRQSQSASPQQRSSPNAGSQQALQQKTQTPPVKYPMAAPPLPQSPANQQQAAASSASPQPGTPLTPGAQSREQRRVALLLELNTELLYELNDMQPKGAGGAAGGNSAGKALAHASEDYMNVLRRIQANLAYLMPVAQGDPSKTPRGPAYMAAPPHMPQLQAKYERLGELFDGWGGHEIKDQMTAFGK